MPPLVAGVHYGVLAVLAVVFSSPGLLRRLGSAKCFSLLSGHFLW